MNSTFDVISAEETTTGLYISSAFSAPRRSSKSRAADELATTDRHTHHVINEMDTGRRHSTPAAGASVPAVHGLARSVGARRRPGAGDLPAALRHDRLHSRRGILGLVAKSIGTAAHLADGRVELGVGVGWCRGIRIDGSAVRPPRQAHRRDAGDGWRSGSRAGPSRRRVLCDAAAGDDADTADTDTDRRPQRYRHAARRPLRRLGRRPDHHRAGHRRRAALRELSGKMA